MDWLVVSLIFVNRGFCAKFYELDALPGTSQQKSSESTRSLKGEGA